MFCFLEEKIKLIKFFVIISLLLGVFWIFFISFHGRGNSNQLNNDLWGGYSPITVYQIFDKDTGVYYAITSEGGICPMYTIEGKVKLVDQGNEYVIHRNLGESNAQK